jgi:hypothetical protein
MGVLFLSLRGSMTKSIFKINGFINSKDYILSLSLKYDVDIKFIEKISKTIKRENLISELENILKEHTKEFTKIYL